MLIKKNPQEIPNVSDNPTGGVVILLTFVVNLSILQQSFLGTLLSTPLLQEKLAENINKVVGG